MNKPGAFTIPEYCVWSRIGRTKVYELIAAGELPIVKVGRKTLIRFCDGQALLDKFLAPDSRPSRKEGGE